MDKRFTKYLAEFIGTFILVFFGCGSAAITGGIGGVLGILGIAFSFGLAIVAAAYAIGHISGCHVNPAVSLAMLIDGQLSFIDFIGYVVAQVLGSCAAASALFYVIKSSGRLDIFETGLGTNGFSALSHTGLSLDGAFVVEMLLTFVFVLTIFGVTSNEKTSAHAGLIIGLTLTFVHIIGIPLTGTSVNPARSLGPALVFGGEALSQVWLFILAPLVGAAIAALVWHFCFKPEDKKVVKTSKKK